MDQIEWADSEIARKAKSSAPIQNPAGFLIYVVQSNHPVPASFVSSRRQRLIEQAAAQSEKERAAAAQMELEMYLWQERYENFVTAQTDAYIAANMAGDVYKRRSDAMRRTLLQNNAAAKGWPQQVIDEYAVRMLREELARDMGLPSFDDFREQEQPPLL
jgi:hypothetical protein